jgi:type IV secretory pathway VirB2 component (pilin)
MPSSGELELHLSGGPSVGLIGVVPVVVVVGMVICGGSALTGRIGWHSTAGLAVVAAANLVVAQLEEGVGRSHPQLGSERGVVSGPVGKEGPRA